MKKKTFFKTAVTVMVAIMLLMSMNLLAFASITEDSDTSSIVVSGLEAGVTVTAYQIIVVNYNYSSDQPNDPMYSWANEKIENWVTSWADNEGDYYADFSDIENLADATSAELMAFYTDMAIWANALDLTSFEETTDGTATYPIDEDALTGSVKFENMDMGIYLIVINGGYRIYQPITVNIVPEYDEESDEWELDDEFEAVVKSTLPGVTIELIEDDNTMYSNNYSTIDTITLKFTMDVPQFTTNYCGLSPQAVTLETQIPVGYSIDFDSVSLEFLENENVQVAYDADTLGRESSTRK